MTRAESELERLGTQIQVELRQGLLGSRNPVKAFARNSFGPELDLNPVADAATDWRHLRAASIPRPSPSRAPLAGSGTMEYVTSIRGSFV